MTENIRSVSIRYPHDADGERPGPGLADQLLISHARDMAEYYVFNLPKISPIAIIKMADCLYYQSCESDDWRDTKAYRQLQWIIGTAYRMMPGYDAAPWEFTDATMYQKAAHLFAESERARQAGIV